MTFRFAYPILLCLFVAVAGWLFYALRRKPPGITYSMTSQIAGLIGSGNRLMMKIPVVLRAICLVLLVLGISRPQLFSKSREISSEGVDIILCLDTSTSMKTQDFKLNDTPVSRLTAVKKVVSEFIKKREFDRIGLIVFGEEAFTQSPLTMDKGLLLDLIKKMEIGMAGNRTAVGTAIAIGGKRLKDLKAKSKILILLTDGRSNAGDIAPYEAAEAVRALGVKIYAIGVGGKGQAPLNVNGLLGENIANNRIDLDEKTLKKIAVIGKGEYFRAADSVQLSKIYEDIDQQEKTEIKFREFFHFKELYPYFVVPALLLMVLEILLKSTVLRIIP